MDIREVTITMSLPLVPGAVSECIALGDLYPSSSPVSWDLEKSKHRAERAQEVCHGPEHWLLPSTALSLAPGVTCLLAAGVLLAVAGGRGWFVGACLGHW